MKVLVIADSHGNITNLKHIMRFGKKIKAGAVIHCGDWNNLKAVETVMAYKIPVYGVLGNADIGPEVGKRLRLASKRFDQKFLEFELDKKKIGIAHDMNFLPKVSILFCGHTHQQYKDVVGGVQVVNPGALENSINFAVYDTISGEVEFITE